MSVGRVLVSCQLDFRGREPAREILEGADLEVVLRPGTRGSADESTRERLEGMDAIIAGGEHLNADTVVEGSPLKIIARNGVGYDAVDVPFCTGRGIVLTTTPGTLQDAVADHTMALLLAAVRHIAAGDRAVKAGEYDVPYGEDLGSMTLGLVGCGQIGSEVVRRALAFKMRVLVADPNLSADRVAELGAVAVTLDELVAQADAVTLHLPLTEATANLVDADLIGRMKAGSVLVNTARGGVVDEPALIEALKSGHLAAAGLDVQANEPAQGVSLDLVRLENVVAMPHCGSKTISARERMSIMAAESIVDLFQGRAPRGTINTDVLEKLGLK